MIAAATVICSSEEDVQDECAELVKVTSAMGIKDQECINPTGTHDNEYLNSGFD